MRSDHDFITVWRWPNCNKPELRMRTKSLTRFQDFPGKRLLRWCFLTSALTHLLPIINHSPKQVQVTSGYTPGKRSVDINWWLHVSMTSGAKCGHWRCTFRHQKNATFLLILIALQRQRTPYTAWERLRSGAEKKDTSHESSDGN